MLTPLVAPAAPALARQARADAPREIAYRQWDTTAELRTGTFSGVTASAGRLRLASPTARRTLGGHRRYPADQPALQAALAARDGEPQ